MSRRWDARSAQLNYLSIPFSLDSPLYDAVECEWNVRADSAWNGGLVALYGVASGSLKSGHMCVDRLHQKERETQWIQPY